MARSLLDGVDLARLRALGGDGVAALVAAALVDTGLLQFDPDDPGWPDRDRLIVCGRDVAAAVRERLAAAGAPPDAAAVFAATGGAALAMAFGAAMSSRLDGNVWRAWCVLDDAACDDGAVWEVARAAADAGADALVAVITGDAAAALWRACGWAVHEVPAADPVWLLGALDQAGVRGPAAVVVGLDD